MIILKFLVTISIAIVIFSCKGAETNSKIKTGRIIVDDVIAEGNISTDTVYNGLIKFYDTTTHQLVGETFYEKGKLNGKRKEYYLNGKIKNVGYYESGKQTGTLANFDSTGALSSSQDFYYDLKGGSNIEYKNGKPNKYYFTSFDNENLVYIDYDSIRNKEIKEINSYHFFFLHTNDFTTISTSGKKFDGKEYFIYIPNPPGFNFEYSLVILNGSDSIIKVEKKFDKTKIWDTFTPDQLNLKKGERFSLRLEVDLDILGREEEKGVMLKRL